MTAKRALIVDDSRSARVILSRMLETHGLHVDTAESAEQALDYLQGAHPDVVFMDHLMPGMDGFEAVRAIKSNAGTADIPVMMYTSQDDEHYAQQARRAGARGVLSKTLRSGDVSRALYDLHLLPDRRESRSTQVQTDDLPPLVVGVTPFADELPTASDASVESTIGPRELHNAVVEAMAEQRAELQQVVQSGIDSLGERLLAELRIGLQEAAVPVQPVAPDEVEENETRGWLSAALVIAALIPTAVIATLYWRTLNDNEAQLQQSTARLAMVVTEQQTQIEQLRAELRRRQESGGALVVQGANMDTVSVPYGDLPFAGERVRRLKVMMNRLQGENFKGILRIVNYVGDFCLSGNPINGYKPARPDLPMRRCDLIGNPFEDGLTATARETPEFSAALAAGGADMRVETLNGGRKPVAVYPTQNEQITAGEWNLAAARNNRVEIVAESTN